MILRVTADTNVYISGLNFGGKPRAVLEAARRGEIELALSPPIMAEIARILTHKFKWPENDLAEISRQLRSFTFPVEPNLLLDVIADDASDNRIIECAVTSSSEYIVSGDAHLIGLKEYAGIRIVNPSTFLNLIRTKNEGRP